MINVKNEETKNEIDAAIDYLSDGGLGEVFGLTYAAMEIGHPKVMSDTSMALALCILADEEIKARAMAKETRQ